jgi:hypothetical protein
MQPRLSRVTAPLDVLIPLTAELRKYKEIADLEGGIINNSPSSNSGPLTVDAFAHWLLAQSRFRPPADCLTELLETVRRNSSPILEIIPIWGMSPKLRFELGDGLSVIPIAELPPSRLKDLMTGKRRHAFSFEIANSSPRPGAAIVKETIHGPIFEGPRSEAALRSDRQSQLMIAVLRAPTPEARHQIMEELARTMDLQKAARESTSIARLAEELSEVIALLVPKPIFVLGQWYQRPQNAPLVGSVGAYSGPKNDPPFHTEIKQEDYPIEEIQSLVAQYRALDESIRKRLRTPLNRLNQGRRNLETGDLEAAAIDLGIAAEALLTQDRDADASISFVLRARGTLLLAGTPNERKDNYTTLRDLYGLRSKVAHEGTLVDRSAIPFSETAAKRLQDATQKANSSRLICTKLITTVIRRAEFPDWDQLMFGW